MKKQWLCIAVGLGLALSAFGRHEALLKQLAAHPTDRGLLKQLSATIASAPNAEQKIRIGTIYALGCLANGMNREWTDVTTQMRRFTPQSPYVALLSLEAVGDICAACGGAGYTFEDCTRCKGTGQCVLCRGSGKVERSSGARPCLTCRETGQCPVCTGSGVQQAACGRCGQSGRVWSATEANAMYLKFLQGWTLEKIQADAAERIAAQKEEIGKIITARKHEREYNVILRSMDEKAFPVQLRVLRVIGQGALVSGYARDHALPNRFLVDRLVDVADGEAWQGMIYPLGVTRIQQGNQSVTLRVFTASKEQAAMGELHAKLGLDQEEARQKKGASTGTGWFYGTGHIVTCYHVVEDRQNIWIVSEALGKIPVKMVLKDERHDLAVLAPAGRVSAPPGLPLARALPSLGERAFTIGFPHMGILGKEPRFTDGSISSLAGMKDDPRTLQMSVPVQSGNSGGALINERGEVVGVVASKLHAANIFRWTGDMPQNVNFAVKVQYLEKLLALLPKSETKMNTLSPVDNAPLVETAKRVQGSIVQVFAE